MFSNVIASTLSNDRPVCAVAVDAEEDFDWQNPIASTDYSTNCMRNIRDLQEVLGAYGIVPTYLLTYPVLDDDDVVHILRRQLGRGQCDVGIQLHPWVTPPFDGDQGVDNSFSGNLAPGLEERKFLSLNQRFLERFGTKPRIYRAGRYGLGQNTTAMLEAHGFDIDTSLAPRTNSTEEGGPDYSSHDYGLFWFGEQRPLLELPLCRSVVGWGGRWAPPVYRAITRAALTRLRVPSIVTRLRFAERITLSPEGNDVRAMIRLVNSLLSRGQRVFVLSFHSSSLAVGRSPYVRNKAELHAFYDRLSGVLNLLATRMGFEFASLAQLPSRLAPAARPAAQQRAAAGAARLPA